MNLKSQILSSKLNLGSQSQKVKNSISDLNLKKSKTQSRISISKSQKPNLGSQSQKIKNQISDLNLKNRKPNLGSLKNQKPNLDLDLNLKHQKPNLGSQSQIIKTMPTEPEHL